jgi:hypothetical protein
VWRGIAMRSDKLFRSYCAALSLAATLIRITSDSINTAQRGRRNLATTAVSSGAAAHAT